MQMPAFQSGSSRQTSRTKQRERPLHEDIENCRHKQPVAPVLLPGKSLPENLDASTLLQVPQIQQQDAELPPNGVSPRKTNE